MKRILLAASFLQCLCAATPAIAAERAERLPEVQRIEERGTGEVEVMLGRELFGIRADVDPSAPPKPLERQLAEGCREADRVVSGDPDDYMINFVPTGFGDWLLVLSGRLKRGVAPEELPALNEMIDMTGYPWFNLAIGNNRIFLFIAPDDTSRISPDTSVAMLLSAVWSNSTCEIVPQPDAATRGEMFRCVRNAPVRASSREALLAAFKDSDHRLLVSGAKFICPSPIDATIGRYVRAGLIEEERAAAEEGAAGDAAEAPRPEDLPGAEIEAELSEASHAEPAASAPASKGMEFMGSCAIVR